MSSGDTFSVSWAVSYDSPFGYDAMFIVECYGSSAFMGSKRQLVLMGELKSVAQVNISHGEAFICQKQWQQAVLVGTENLDEFMRSIILEKIDLNDEELEMVMNGLYESLEEGLNAPMADPRYN